jgi:hypothetical protein
MKLRLKAQAVGTPLGRSPCKGCLRRAQLASTAGRTATLLARGSTCLLFAWIVGVSVEGCSSDSAFSGGAPSAGGTAGSTSGGISGGGGSGLGGASGIGGAPGAGGESGESGAAGAGVTPCDTSKSPSEESCLVGDEFAVFVAPTGADSATGTMSSPVATLSKAIEMAAGSKFVIVCDATYDEHVVVSGGAQVYGGFSCAGGSWASEAKAPLFKPSDAGPALKMDRVGDAVLIDTVNFEVPDAKVAGGTALAAIVNASPSVTLRNVTLTAGAGMNGADGTLTNFSYAQDPTALNGYPENTADPTHNGAEKDCTCQSGLMSIGGGGGPPSSSGQAGALGLPDHGAGQPGIPGSCGATGTGKDGSDAPASAASAGGTTLGMVSSSEWQPTPGLDGTTGSPGQGGGGGASRNSSGHGGGGACGGCGGNGAKAGQGGGGSIALLALDSPVTLDTCTLRTKDAGSGGAGTVGQLGQQTVGNGGNSIANTNSCGGGAGGKGGDGGASGGGAGGISVGIVWKGAVAPTLTNTTSTTGQAGAKGVGGAPGTNDGIVGVKQDVLQVP